ncbi:helix-turn-helix domain-containing protein [Paenibacillus oryzisoli]|uniref:helix-turn-helix domain-containing protein n=1 Tax=Paenibacillus oryzisoli TaxID=1850517 RepID=UPI003D294997
MLLLMFSPEPRFAPYIDRILVQEDFQAVNYANQNPVKVLPSAFCVIGIQYGHPMKRVEGDTEQSMGSSGITGLQTSPRSYLSTGSIGTIILTFKPGGLAAFTPYSIQEFQDANVDLDCIFPKQLVADMEDRLREALDATERVSVVQEFLACCLQERQQDAWLVEAAQQIQLLQGNISVEQMAKDWFVSKRTLERKFNRHVGLTPKKFANLVRFQHVIALRKCGLDYLDIIAACQFSDHAHLIHDFEAFAGCSPEVFFRTMLQPDLADRFNGQAAGEPTIYQ